MSQFENLCQELQKSVDEWEQKLKKLPLKTVEEPKNSQNRSIKQIVGHMVDSASNNTHRIIHLQYQKSPASFPDYANLGNNDKWIDIQNYQNEPWDLLVQVWKNYHLHLCYVIMQVDESKLENRWHTALRQEVSLMDMITDFPRHFDLHTNEIIDLIKSA